MGRRRLPVREARGDTHGPYLPTPGRVGAAESSCPVAGADSSVWLLMPIDAFGSLSTALIVSWMVVSRRSTKLGTVGGPALPWSAQKR